MLRSSIAFTVFLLLTTSVMSQEADPDEVSEQPDAVESEAEPAAEADPDGPRAMSGMSILGNEEAPKSLVIIPWKSSELGDDLDMSNALDGEPEPVDKDVFLRELRFYEIRSGQ